MGFLYRIGNSIYQNSFHLKIAKLIVISSSLTKTIYRNKNTIIGMKLFRYKSLKCKLIVKLCRVCYRVI